MIPVSFEISEAKNHQAHHSLKKIRNKKQPVSPNKFQNPYKNLMV
jgi:hypothetical protein